MEETTFEQMKKFYNHYLPLIVANIVVIIFLMIVTTFGCALTASDNGYYNFYNSENEIVYHLYSGNYNESHLNKFKKMHNVNPDQSFEDAGYKIVYEEEVNTFPYHLWFLLVFVLPAGMIFLEIVFLKLFYEVLFRGKTSLKEWV